LGFVCFFRIEVWIGFCLFVAFVLLSLVHFIFLSLLPVSRVTRLHKYLPMYAARVALCCKNCLHFNLVTDASCHGCKDTLVSVSYSHENDCVAFAASQYVKSGKVVFPGEFSLATEVERIFARRERERLHSYKFIQAISNQLLQLSGGNIQLESFVPAPHLCLEPAFRC
jgi:hypothetical protein